MEFDVRRIARLARLELEEGEAQRLSLQMAEIVDMVSRLPEIEDPGPVSDPESGMCLREDRVLPSLPREELLRNAPRTAEGCFVVPRTVE